MVHGLVKSSFAAYTAAMRLRRMAFADGSGATTATLGEQPRNRLDRDNPPPCD
jgi:hypothetical protein